MGRLALLLLLAGCVPLSYAFTPSARSQPPAKPAGCKFDMHTSMPSEGFEEIGTLEHYNGDPPKDTEKMRKAVAEQVCQLGGDAVIATQNEKGFFTKGQVIKYVKHAEPVKPISDPTPMQSPDNELPKK
jgi:hypothetical protein